MVETNRRDPLRVGGPATAGAAWIPEFLEHVSKSGSNGVLWLSLPMHTNDIVPVTAERSDSAEPQSPLRRNRHPETIE